MKKIISVIVLSSLLLSLCACRIDIMNYSVYANAVKYTTGGGSVKAEEVKSIEVNWISGSVKIEVKDDTDTITFSETSSLDTEKDALGEATENKELKESLKMRYLVEGGKLIIQFCKSALSVRAAAVKDLKKDLTVTVPSDAEFEKIKADIVSSDLFVSKAIASDISVNSVSADVKLVDIKTDAAVCKTVSGNVEIKTDNALKTLRTDTVSGDLNAECTADETEFRSVSGKTEFKTGSDLKKMKVDTTSGAVKLEAPAVDELSVKGVSANVSLILEKADLTLKMTGVSTSVEANGVKYEKTEEKTYKFGDGAGSVTVNSVSGTVSIEVK